MNLHSLYRASVYVMLVLATLILSVDASDYNRFALLYPLGVALAAVGAFLTVDRDPRLGLGRDLANFLALGSILLAIAEYAANPGSLVVALGHWLVYLQLVKMYLPKTNEDDWFLFLLSVVQVVVGSFIGQSDHIGGLLLLWVVVSLAALGLFYLRRETDRFENADGSTLTPAPNPKRPYPGLIDPGFLLSGALVTVSTIALGGLIFLLMPRWGSGNAAPAVPGAPRHLTGFSDQVRLGQMGEILESDSLVMTVESLGDDGRGLEARDDEQPLWGGVTLVTYQDGRWTREASTHLGQPAAGAVPQGDRRLIRHRIRLESTNSESLFAVRPLVWAAGQRSRDLEINRYDGTLTRRTMRGEDSREDGPPRRARSAYEYEVVSLLGDRGLVAPFEFPPERDRQAQLLDMPDPVREALTAYNRPIVEALPERLPIRIARAFESHFRDSGLFGYSLRQTRVDASLDPVVDFVLNRKEGHCEYYASALALMLRAEGIPARVVNGFKGGDWNPLVRAWLVREKHAHSWVEALVGTETLRSGGKAIDHPVWLVLDPTPAGQRAQVVAQVGANPQFRTVFDALRHIWVFNIIGFNGDTQERLIYGPIRRFLNEARRGFLFLQRHAVALLARLFVFRSAGEFFSVRGFLASVTVMLLLLGGFLIGRASLGRLLRTLRPDDADGPGRHPEVTFFLRLVRLLSRSGLERAPAETQREFARRAASFLAARPPASDTVASVPEQVVDAYYRVRFGHRPLDDEAVAWLDARLDDLERSLEPAG
jgi:transglutaminase-like putative cysteine protease